MRNACSPREAVAWQLVAREIDVRDVLSSIRVPTLILQCLGDRMVPPPVGRYLAEHITGSRYVEREGTEHLAWLQPDRVTSDIRDFLTGERTSPSTNRILATVLFTDLVGSTDTAARMGDAAWRGLLETHHASARREIAAHRGIEVGSAGDGFLARFDGPGWAIRCAEAITYEAARHGLEVRAGVHTGEVELVGDDVAGLAVHIGARIAGMAGPGEVLVSGSVRDISAGSGISFVDRGEQELRGVPGTWRVYAVGKP
jgi:class 3 adenylate cyclase